MLSEILFIKISKRRILIMKSERLLFVLVALLLIASLTACSSSATPTNNPIPSSTTVPLLTSTASPTSTLQPTELSQETATVSPTQAEWLFQVTVTLDKLGPVLGGTLGGGSGYNWGILETQTPIQEGINPVSVYDPSGLGQMCAQGMLVEGQPMVTSMIGGACLVEIPVP
jgi:hypothetical protein